MKHFLSIKDLAATEAMDLVLRAKEMKDADYRSDLLAGKTLAMIFEKASTRTRVLSRSASVIWAGIRFS